MSISTGKGPIIHFAEGTYELNLKMFIQFGKVVLFHVKKGLKCVAINQSQVGPDLRCQTKVCYFLLI